MATPSRLVQLACPACSAAFWVIDSDWRGATELGGKELTYSQREYTCASCRTTRSGHTVIAKSPPEFLLQPHDHYPMSATDFEHWASVLREHFPDHPKLLELGRSFFPTLPGAPVATVEMWHEAPGQQPQCTLDPKVEQVAEWLGRLGPEAQLTLEYKLGLKLVLSHSRMGKFDVACAESSAVIAEAKGLPKERVLKAVDHFLQGNGDACLRAIAPSD